MTLDEAEKAIAIFRKYEPAPYSEILSCCTSEEAHKRHTRWESADLVHAANHDEIWGGPNPEKVSPEDKLALEELGWHDYDGESFHKFV